MFQFKDFHDMKKEGLNKFALKVSYIILRVSSEHSVLMHD